MLLTAAGAAIWLCSIAVQFRFMNWMLRAKYNNWLLFSAIVLFNLAQSWINIKMGLYKVFPQQIFYLSGSILALCLFFEGSITKKVLTAIMMDTVGYTFNFVFLPLCVYASYRFQAVSQRWLFLLCDLLTALASFLIYQVIEKKFPMISRRMTMGSCIYLLCSSIFLSGAVIYYIEQNLEDLRRSELMAGWCTLFAICGIFLILFSIYYVDCRLTLSLMEQQAAIQKQHVMAEKEREEKTRRFRHDLRNHMICMGNLMKSGYYEQAISYLERVFQTVEGMAPKVSTGNLYVDALVREKCRIAEKERIRMDVDLILPAFNDEPPMELITILSNALDNALESCQKLEDPASERWMKARACVNRAYLVIEVDNPVPKSWGKEGSWLRTTKHDATHHGIGLSNIKTAVKRCHGTCSFAVSDGIFHFFAMIRL